MNQRIEIIETVLDDAVQRELEIVRQTRTVIALTSDRQARPLGEARDDAQQGQTQTYFGNERRRQLIGEQPHLLETLTGDRTRRGEQAPGAAAERRRLLI